MQSLYTISTLPIVATVEDVYNEHKYYTVYKSRRTSTHYIQQFVKDRVTSKAIRINKADLRAIYGVVV